jgi:hypothetical protein
MSASSRTWKSTIAPLKIRAFQLRGLAGDFDGRIYHAWQSAAPRFVHEHVDESLELDWLQSSADEVRQFGGQLSAKQLAELNALLCRQR